MFNGHNTDVFWISPLICVALGHPYTSSSDFTHGQTNRGNSPVNLWLNLKEIAKEFKPGAFGRHLGPKQHIKSLPKNIWWNMVFQGGSPFKGFSIENHTKCMKVNYIFINYNVMTIYSDVISNWQSTGFLKHSKYFSHNGGGWVEIRYHFVQSFNTKSCTGYLAGKKMEKFISVFL